MLAMQDVERRPLQIGLIDTNTTRLDSKTYYSGWKTFIDLIVLPRCVRLAPGLYDLAESRTA